MKKTIKYNLFILTFWCSKFTLLAQHQKIDSLQTLIKTDLEDTNKFNHLNELIWQLMEIGEYKKAMAFSQHSLQLAEKIKYTNGVAESYKSIGWVKFNQGQHQASVDAFRKSLNLFQKLKDKKKIAQCYSDLGYVLMMQGQTTISLKYYLKALKIYEDSKDSLNMAFTYEAVGSFYYDVMHDFLLAEEYYLKSLKIYQQLNKEWGINDLNSYLGMAYWKAGKYDLGIEYLQKGLEFYKKKNSKSKMAYNHNAIGMVYYDIGKYSLAEENLLISLKLNIEIDNNSVYGTHWNYGNLGKVRIKQNRFDEAVKYLLKALKLAKEMGFKAGQQEEYEFLASAYKGQKKYLKAIEAYELSSILKDSLFNTDNSKKITEMQLAFDGEKKEAIRQLEDEKKESEHQAEIRQQKIIIYSVSIGLALVFALAFFIFKGYRQKQKTNLSLAEKNRIIQEKNKDILDSIRYAKRIQTSLLPTDKYIDRILSEKDKNTRA